jgi:hypothetical protein
MHVWGSLSTERPVMNDNEPATRGWDGALERLAAEVTETAYAIALRHGARDKWVELELGLWEELTRAVRRWGCLDPDHPGRLPRGGSERPEAVSVLDQERE